jgi:pyruvate ferredoxin oxidoreductase alpha subunit
MSMRDAGWIQLYAETNQEAADLHIQAFHLAETLSCPVMVCMDGYILTHAYERVDLPSQAQVDAYLPSYDPVQVLDPVDPVSIGAMVGPEAFAEVRYLAYHKQIQALDLIPRLSAEFQQMFGRASGGLITPYHASDADTVVIALGSVIGTIQEAIDDLRREDIAIGCVKVGSYRPFPSIQLRTAIQHVKRVIVVEKDLAVGKGGIVSSDVKMALRGLPVTIHTVIAGLGGRAIPKASVKRVIQEALADGLDEPHFLDLNWTAVNNELERQRQKRRSGPIAENVLRDVNAVASKVI